MVISRRQAVAKLGNPARGLAVSKQGLQTALAHDPLRQRNEEQKQRRQTVVCAARRRKKARAKLFRLLLHCGNQKMRQTDQKQHPSHQGSQDGSSFLKLSHTVTDRDSAQMNSRCEMFYAHGV